MLLLHRRQPGCIQVQSQLQQVGPPRTDDLSRGSGQGLVAQTICAAVLQGAAQTKVTGGCIEAATIARQQQDMSRPAMAAAAGDLAEDEYGTAAHRLQPGRVMRPRPMPPN